MVTALPVRVRSRGLWGKDRLSTDAAGVLGRYLPDQHRTEGSHDERREAGEDQRVAQRQQIDRTVQATACAALASEAEHM